MMNHKRVSRLKSTIRVFCTRWEATSLQMTKQKCNISNKKRLVPRHVPTPQASQPPASSQSSGSFFRSLTSLGWPRPEMPDGDYPYALHCTDDSCRWRWIKALSSARQTDGVAVAKRLLGHSVAGDKFASSTPCLEYPILSPKTTGLDRK